MDYTTLAKTVQAYVENDFPSTLGTGGLSSAEQVATFVSQAEQRIYNMVQLPVARKNVTGNMTANNPYLTTPSDWMSNYSLAIKDPVTGEYEFLLNKDVNFIREAYPPPNAIGKPEYYAIFDQNTYIIGPTPDLPYPTELHYYFYPQSIVTAGTSWLGDNFDSTLLYGALLEAHAYMKGEADVLQNYQTRYDQALSMLKQYGEGKIRQDTYRSEQTRYPVR